MPCMAEPIGGQGAVPNWSVASPSQQTAIPAGHGFIEDVQRLGARCVLADDQRQDDL